MPKFVDMNGEKIEYATEEEVLNFCNKIREVGGGEAIKSLLGGVPLAASACMIANSLNFDSTVIPIGRGKSERWVMCCSVEVVNKIVDSGLCDRWDNSAIHVVLPRRIGYAAYAFDEKQGWTAKLIEYKQSLETL